MLVLCLHQPPAIGYSKYSHQVLSPTWYSNMPVTHTWIMIGSVQTGSWCSGSGLSDIAWQVQIVVVAPGPLFWSDKLKVNVCQSTFMQRGTHACINKQMKPGLSELGNE